MTNPLQLVQNVSQISNGFQLSPNFLLEHMTTGAFNKVLGKWTPQLPQQLIPWLPNGIFSQGFPLLSLVQNLQGISGNVLEQLLSAAGSQLNVRAGFVASTDSSKVTSLNPYGYNFETNTSVDNVLKLLKSELEKIKSNPSISNTTLPIPLEYSNEIKKQVLNKVLNSLNITESEKQTLLTELKEINNTLLPDIKTSPVLETQGFTFIEPTISPISEGGGFTFIEPPILPWDSDIKPLVNESGHSNGTSIDIAIEGFSNPVYIAKDIQKLCRNAVSMAIVFGQQGSHFHINFDPNNITSDLPLIKSVDLVTGENLMGIIPFRGFS